MKLNDTKLKVFDYQLQNSNLYLIHQLSFKKFDNVSDLLNNI